MYTKHELLMVMMFDKMLNEISNDHKLMAWPYGDIQNTYVDHRPRLIIMISDCLFGTDEMPIYLKILS